LEVSLKEIKKWAIGELNPGSQAFTNYGQFFQIFLSVRRSFIRPALVDQACKPVNHFSHLEKLKMKAKQMALRDYYTLFLFFNF